MAGQQIDSSFLIYISQMADPLTCIATFLGPIYNACCAPVHAAIGETVASYLNRKRNWRALLDALGRLYAKAEKLKVNIEEEAQQLGVCNSDVEDWQKRVEKFMLLANRVVDDDSGGCAYRCRAAPKISRLLAEADCLLREGEKFSPPFTHSAPPDAVEHLADLKPTFGMDSILQKLWSQFNLEEDSVVGVYGLGGVGKTTLLKIFNNMLRQRPGDYQVVIMIEVANSETLNVVTMQRTISDRLGLLWKRNQSEKDRATFLLQVLRKKKFVMLLDAVWRKFELEDVGIPVPNSSNGCKLVVASRRHNVCAKMGAMNPIAMQCLEKKEAWDLFLSKLTNNVKAAINEDKGMYQRAEEIVNSCDGLPLALNVVGSALACSREPNEWKHAARAMTQNISRISGADKMLTVLKYSYDMLDDRDRQKECFLYCALFPDYGSINKDLLVDYWMAEGLISAEPYEGYKVISKLVSACLLQSSDTEPNSEVTMHQMIRRMGHQQASEFFVEAGKALKQAPNVQDWKKFTRISLMSNDIRDLSISPDCQRLLTLLLQNNPNLRLLGPNFFKSMSSLKVLDLSHTAIENLPDCSALSQLVYLNLSHTLVKEVPKKLCNALVELLYLNMSDTRIHELPQHLWKLQKLTHLYLGETSALSIIPRGTISKLYKLKVLNIYRSNYGIKDVDDLNLDKLEELKFLGITIYSQEVFAKLKRTDPLAISTRCLSLSCCPKITSIQLSEFKKMEHLKELHIESCSALEKLIVDHVEKEDSVKRVKILTLASLPNLVEVSFGTATHRFQDLRDLTIRSCPKLKHVSWVMRLQSLERLVISDCDGLEELVLEEEKAAATTASPLVHSMNGGLIVEGRDELPRLRIMELKGLKSLRSIYQKGRSFPGLESIRVEGCWNLKDLPATGVPKLKQICGEVGWWEELSPETRTSSLGDCFVPI